jgi:hypothetical protein
MVFISADTDTTDARNRIGSATIETASISRWGNMPSPHSTKARQMNVIPPKVREALKRFSDSRMGHLLRTALFMLLFVNLLHTDPPHSGWPEWVDDLSITLSRIYVFLLAVGSARNAGAA